MAVIEPVLLPEAGNTKPTSAARAVVLRPNAVRRGLFWVTPDAPQSRVFRELGRDQRIVCLRAPPHSDSRPPTLHELACYYADTVMAYIEPDQPLTLVGYCIAGVLAREVARELQDRGKNVDSLTMIDPPDPAKSNARLIDDPVVYRIAQQARRYGFHSRRLLGAGPGAAFQYLRGMARGAIARGRYRRSKAAYDEALKEPDSQLNAYRDSYHISVAAFLSSTPVAYEGAVRIVRPKEVPYGAFKYADRRWLQLLPGKVSFKLVEGNSTSMWEEPTVASLAEIIREGIA